MFVVREIDHVVLRVSDMDAMIRFYCEVLGTTVARRRPDLGMVHLCAGTSMIDLVAVDGPLGSKGGAAPGTEARNMDHLCLRVEPFDEATIVAHLKSHSASLGEIRSRFGAEGTGISIYLTDPEGNVVELKGPSDGDTGPNSSGDQTTPAP